MRRALFIDILSWSAVFKVDNNVVANVINRLPIRSIPFEDPQEPLYFVIECYRKNQKYAPKHDLYPLLFAHLEVEKQSDSLLKKEIKKFTCMYHVKDFLRRFKTISLICYKDKINAQKTKSCN
jgi:hypothetical protein